MGGADEYKHGFILGCSTKMSKSNKNSQEWRSFLVMVSQDNGFNWIGHYVVTDAGSFKTGLFFSHEEMA